MQSMVSSITRLFVLLLLPVLAGCGTVASAQQGNLATRPINVLATTGMIADLAQHIGGARVQVTGLMGPGVDPHLYKPSAGDVRRLAGADIIFYGGLNLEGRMEELFGKLGTTGRPTIAVTRDIAADRLHPSADYANAYDPHVWFDVQLWRTAAVTVQQALSELDPTSAEVYAANLARYDAELVELDTYVQQQIASIPPASRVLITAHDAFGYFGARYGIEVRGLQGISTAAEAGAADVRALSALLTERKIKAVFIESSVPQTTVDAVREATIARGWKVAIGGELFSDALGSAGTPEGTYIGMVRHNADTIANALR